MDQEDGGLEVVDKWQHAESVIKHLNTLISEMKDTVVLSVTLKKTY